MFTFIFLLLPTLLLRPVFAFLLQFLFFSLSFTLFCTLLFWCFCSCPYSCFYPCHYFISLPIAVCFFSSSCSCLYFCSCFCSCFYPCSCSCCMPVLICSLLYFLQKISGVASMPDSHAIPSPSLSRKALDYTYIVWKQVKSIKDWEFIMNHVNKRLGKYRQKW